MATSPPPARCAPRSMPVLPDDLMREIFLRLPPGDPRALVRTAAGCRSWRCILSAAAFARDYRKFWRAPPMLGFLYEQLDTPYSRFHDYDWVAHFVPTATFRPPAGQDRSFWHVLDSRHGLVLFHTPRRKAEFLVCDLVTGNKWKIHANPQYCDIMSWEWDDDEEKIERIRCNAAVFCANDRCGHLDCHGGPFRIALVGSDRHGRIACASFYSSATREWSNMIEVQTPGYIYGPCRQNAVVGNKVYVPCVDSDSVVEYNMDEQKLSLIDCPLEDMNEHPYIQLMGVEDGMLLFASVVKPRLYLWSMDVGPSAAVGWARRRVIELELSLPPHVLSEGQDVSTVGFAEGVCVIFLDTAYGLYTIDLNSGEGKKVLKRHITKVMPYMSFYTGAWGRLLTLE